MDCHAFVRAGWEKRSFSFFLTYTFLYSWLLYNSISWTALTCGSETWTLRKAVIKGLTSCQLWIHVEKDREDRLEGERIFSRMDERRSKNRNHLEEENAMDWLCFEKWNGCCAILWKGEDQEAGKRSGKCTTRQRKFSTPEENGTEMTRWCRTGQEMTS